MSTNVISVPFLPCDRYGAGGSGLGGNILQVQKAAISASKELSDKAVASAKAAGGRAAENDAALERTEGRIAGRLDEIIQTQVYAVSRIGILAISTVQICTHRTFFQQSYRFAVLADHLFLVSNLHRM